jgi:hypothetical protein
MYYNSVQTNVFSLLPYSSIKFTAADRYFSLLVNATHSGNSSSSGWAQIGVMNLSAKIQTTNSLTNNTVPRYVTYSLSLSKGWNLFSVPLAHAFVHNTTCTSGIIASPIWQLVNGSYRKASSVYGGAGYWIRSRGSCSVTFFGSNATYEMPSLSQGWSSIGAPETSTAFSYLAGSCSAVRLVGFNASSNSYYNVSTTATNNQTGLSPGAGYLIKVAGACSLGSSSMPPSPP